VDQLAQISNITLRLARDDVVVNGRLLDLEGQPITECTVTVLRVEKPALSTEPTDETVMKRHSESQA
jgi:hypothetical protein